MEDISHQGGRYSLQLGSELLYDWGCRAWKAVGLLAPSADHADVQYMLRARELAVRVLPDSSLEVTEF